MILKFHLILETPFDIFFFFFNGKFFYKHLAEEDIPANICTQNAANIDSAIDFVYIAILLASVEHNGINATCCIFICQSIHVFLSTRQKVSLPLVLHLVQAI